MAIEALGDRVIRVGMIGAGTISRSHARCLLACENVDLAACCDIALEAVEQFVGEFDVRRSFTDYRELIQEDLDAVVVATPPFAHKYLVIGALEAGKHVLCEKPFAMNAREAAAMADAARHTGLGLAVCCSRNRFREEAQLTQEVLESGMLGDIYRSRQVFLRRRGRPGFDILKKSAWFLDFARSGGGVIADLGHYQLDQIFWHLGWPEVVSVSANVTRNTIEPVVPSKTKNDVEEHVDATIRFSDGTTSVVELSWITHMEGANGMWFYGSCGGVRVTEDVVLFHDLNGRPVETKVPPARRFDQSNVDRDFIEALRVGRDPVTTADQGVVISKVIDGIYASSKRQAEVKI